MQSQLFDSSAVIYFAYMYKRLQCLWCHFMG